MNYQPSTPEQRLLWLLVAHPDGEFESVLKPSSAKQSREALARAKLIEIDKRIKPDAKRKVPATYLRLTDAGWAWCGQEMSWTKPHGKGELFLNSLLQRLKVLIDNHASVASLADFIVKTTAAQTVSSERLRDRIREACLELGGGRESVRIRIADLRKRLADVPPSDLTENLRELSRLNVLTFYPLDDPRQITPADVAAAIPSSTGVPQHILYYGGLVS